MSFTTAVVAKVFRFFKRALSGKVPLTITVVAKVGCPWGYKNFFDLSRFNRFHLFRNNFMGLCHDTFHISTLVVWGETSSQFQHFSAAVPFTTTLFSTDWVTGVSIPSWILSGVNARGAGGGKPFTQGELGEGDFKGEG